MLQTIGLIVAVYALFRTIQLPLQMHATESDKFFGMPASARMLLVAILSGGTFAVLALLTLVLLTSSVDMGE